MRYYIIAIVGKYYKTLQKDSKCKFLVCINHGRALAGATIARFTTRAPAMIARACAHAGPGVGTPLLIGCINPYFIFKLIIFKNSSIINTIMFTEVVTD